MKSILAFLWTPAPTPLPVRRKRPVDPAKASLACYFYFREWGARPCDAWTAAINR